MRLTISVLKEEFAICRFGKNTPIPDWAFKSHFYSITKTEDELSIVCSQKCVKEGEGEIDKDWKALKVAGPLDFSLVGIMANLSTILASGGVSVFVISTFETDYIFVKKDNLELAIKLLKESGHTVS